MQMPLFPVQSNWSPPSELPELGELFALDLETHDPDMGVRGPSWAFPGRGRIAGVSVADDKGFCAYFPIGHEYGGNMDRRTVLAWVKEQVSNPRRKMVCANALYDVGWLMREGIEPLCELHDVQIMGPLLNEHLFSFSLNNLGRIYLNRKKDEDLLKTAARDFGLKNPKAEMYKLPPEYVGPYAEEDAQLTLDLYTAMWPKILREDLEEVYELERSLIIILVKMRLRGVRVDLAYAKKLRDQYFEERLECIRRMKHLTGVEVDEWSADSVATALMHEGIEPARTEKGNYSITADWLESLSSEKSAVPGLILRARKLQKAYSTFIDNAVFGHHENGRIHAQFHPLRNDDGGTISGRFSGSDPNLQQIPARDPEFGPAIRKIYLPEEGEEWCAVDYSAQEPRWTVHWAKKIDAIGADYAVQKYREDADTDYHQMVADMCGIARKQAKTINLGLTYGMQGPKLCHELGLPTRMEQDQFGNMREVAGEEGEALMNLYHERVPFVKALSDRAQQRAKQVGYIKTYTGRRLRFVQERKNGRAYYGKVHAALNRLIQGSSADQMKIALRDLYKNNILPLVTVHDENGFSIKSREEAQFIEEIMLKAVELEVPNKVDVEIGRSWGHSMLGDD